MKKILITGATKGIGLASSQMLAKSGYQVIGIARNDSPNFPGELFLTDLADAKATAETITLIKETHPILYGVMNNVGIAMPEPLGKIDLNHLQSIFDLNVRVAVQITQAFIRPLS